MSRSSIQNFPIQRIYSSEASQHQQNEEDWVAVEAPLEIRLGHGNHPQQKKSVSITMRTPGPDDAALAAGFLFSEGILTHPSQIQRIAPCGPRASQANHTHGHVIRVDLYPQVEVNLQRLERHFYTTSSCGVCGKSSLEALNIEAPFGSFALNSGPMVKTSLIHELPLRLQQHQSLFAQTGGLHAVALFHSSGELIQVCEDVGRHNAMDKLIGHQFMANLLPLNEHFILLSGRASFELMQKALMAGIPLVAAIGAPSSLAVEVARQFQMTLLGFVRNHRFNLYHGEWRLEAENSSKLAPLSP